MASFKEVLIKDKRMESSRKLQDQMSSSEVIKDYILHVDREEPNREEDDLPNIDEIEIPDCEKFKNLFLIGKMLGTKEKKLKERIKEF